MNKLKALIAFSAIAASALAINVARASDHDDGEADLKSRALNLTDVYAFREDKEVAGGSAAHIVFLINSNPRSIPKQQYYFSTQASYDLHISRVGTSKDVPATKADDILLSFKFGAPDSSNRQAMTITTTIDGVVQTISYAAAGGAIYTTPLASGATPVNTNVTINGQTVGVFAGLRKDPFFFDVTSFFKFRAAAAATNGAVPVAGFAAFPTYTPNGETAHDFTENYNVNTLALRVPIALLRTAASETVFDTWATISVPQ